MCWRNDWPARYVEKALDFQGLFPFVLLLVCRLVCHGTPASAGEAVSFRSKRTHGQLPENSPEATKAGIPEWSFPIGTIAVYLFIADIGLMEHGVSKFGGIFVGRSLRRRALVLSYTNIWVARVGWPFVTTDLGPICIGRMALAVKRYRALHWCNRRMKLCDLR